MTFEGSSRWSLACKCPRAGTLALMGAEPREPTNDERLLWRRGKDCERLILDQLTEKHGPENVVAQKAVAWPAGITHPDAFVVTEQTTYEVKSGVDLEPTDDFLLQLAGQVRWDTDSQGGMLVLVDPRNYQSRALPFPVTAEWRDRVDEIAATVVRAPRSGVLPPCSAGSPTECRMAKRCPFTEQAWDGWEPPSLEQVNGEVAKLAAELHAAEIACRNAQGSVTDAEARRKEVRARLRALLTPGREYLAGDYWLKVTVEEQPRVHYRAAEALKVGVLDVEVLAPFRTVEEAPREHWTLHRVEAGAPVAVAEDFGEAAPF